MRLGRMTTRRWIVAVTVAAVGMAVVVWVRRWPDISAKREVHALFHAIEETAATKGTPFEDDVQGRIWLPPVIQVKQAPNSRLAAYHAAMKSKWERASRYPWLPVAPDPPQPK